jgi:predicted CopG family antitoxin
MKNITVSVDDETYRRARIKAAEQDTSVSAVVKRLLGQYVAEESAFERMAREEREARKEIRNFSAADTLTRDELYSRRR